MIEIEDNMGHSPTTEYLEIGHNCPRCDRKTICSIEDGFCFNQGVCSNCYERRILDQEDEEERKWQEYYEMQEEEFQRQEEGEVN